ncbi:MAG: tripartite tricarboxylate transporter permease, partial [Myxococcota bacterium]
MTIGLAMAMVGLDPLLSEPRYTLGWSYLLSGFQVVPVLMGAFAVPQIIEGMRHLQTGDMATLHGRIVPNLATVRRFLPTIGRSG